MNYYTFYNMERYQFDKENHIHTLDGKPLLGVTSVLSVISKPALVQWSANEAIKYIKENLSYKRLKLFKKGYLVIKDKVLEEARMAHRIKKEVAGDWGTELHKAVEDWIKEKVIPTRLFQENQIIAFDNFVKWSKDNKVKFLESEKHIWSEKLWIGGICDMVIEMDGKKYIADIKTSSGIYNEAFFQMGAYDMCLEEMGTKDISGYIVINLKKDGKMEIKETNDMLQNREAFKFALGLYKIVNSLKK